MKTLVLVLFVCLSALLPLAAQTGQPPATLPPTFRIISASGSYTGLLYDSSVGGKKTAVPIDINQALSAPLARPAGKELEIYRLVPPPPDAPPGTKPTRQVVVTVPMPANPADCIVVTFPTSTNKMDPLIARVVPPAPDSHQAGTVRVVNFSNFEAAVGMDERSTSFSSGSVDVMKAGTGRVLFQVAVNKGQGWAKAFRGERRISPQLRGYVFVFNYMVDPDYGPDSMPPPATVKTFFEVSPETRQPVLASR